MNFTKKNIRYIKYVLKWTLIGVLLGVLGGILGAFFHHSLDSVTLLRENNLWMIALLPLGGIVITAMYKMFITKGNIDTKRVFLAAQTEKDVPVVMMPLIFIGTVITHALGGSAGREGAALQIGGSMGYNVGRLLKLEKKSLKTIVTAGMSSVFSALFGTPLAAAVFSLEVTNTGRLNYKGFLPGIVASIVALGISQFLGVTPVRFKISATYEYSFYTLLQVVILSILCAGICIIFATAIHKTEKLMTKYIPDSYIRAFAGGVIIIALTIAAGCGDYNGAGMKIIERAVSGNAKYEAFILKIAFTAVTVAAGFKGGEIVPTFFIGATFGCAVSEFLGLDGSIGAALGFAALFSGMTKCPAAAFLLALEVFGTDGTLYFASSVVIAYILSGQFGLYGNGKKLSGKKKIKQAV